MDKFGRTEIGNSILHHSFRKTEISWAVSDISKAIGPIIDLFFVSQFIGPQGVTVLGYVTPLLMFLELIGSTIANGSRVKVSSLVGAVDFEGTRRCFSTAVVMGIVVSVFFAVLIPVFSSAVCFLLGARDSQIGLMTGDYIRGYIVGMPFFAMNRILMPFLQMEGQYKRLTIASVVATVIDVIADAVVIFVLHGGMFEIGLATSLGYIAAFFISSSFFLNRKNGTVFKFSFKGVKLSRCVEIVRLGAPYGTLKTSNAVGGSLINNLLTSFQMQYLVAAYGVFSQITIFCRASWYAPADTLVSFTGVFIGEEDRQSLKKIQKMSLLRSLIYTGLVTVILFTLAPIFARVFLKSNDPQALDLCIECIRVAAFSIPFYSVVYNFNNYLMAVKRLRFDTFYSFLIECGNLVPITFLLLQVVGYQGAWIGRVVNMLELTLLAAFYIHRQKQKGSFSDKMLLMPETFGIPSENEISVTTDSTEEILDLSHIAIAFALEHGADKKRARSFGLLTEELAGYLAEHGFSDGKKHYINVRLVSKGEDLIIRIRDDCRPFNVTEYYKAMGKSHDLEKDLSLAIIMRRAKDVRYASTFGANNLVIRI